MSYVLMQQEFDDIWWQIVNRCKMLFYPMPIDAPAKIKLKYPHPSLWLRANELYKKTFTEAVNEGIRTYLDLERDFIKKYNIFSEEDIEKVEQIKSLIKVEKRELQKIAALSPVIVKKKKDEIKKLELHYGTLLLKKMKYHKQTAESFAEEEKNKYLAACCSYFADENLENMEPCFSSIDVFRRSTDITFINFLTTSMGNFLTGFSHEILRAIARHPHVRVQWRICRKTGINFFGMPVEIKKGMGEMFHDPVTYWTNDQINLSSWLLYYDDIMESYTPPEWLLKDDEKLDKWVEKQIEKKEAERLKNLGASERGSYDHDDVIVMGEDKELIFEDYAFGQDKKDGS